MEFNFPAAPKRREGELYLPQEMELWTPVEERPNLNPKEMNTLLKESQAVDSLHVAIPSIIVGSENGQLGYIPCFEMERYFIIARLKQSPYMVFYEERKSSKHMQQMMKEGFAKNSSNYYLFDAFFTPFFGGLTPRYFLFQRSNFEEVPEAMVLFRDLS